MRERPAFFRKAADWAVRIVSVLASALGVFFLAWILLTVIRRGAAAFSFEFFTAAPTPPGVEGGGLGPAILGTLVISLLATAIGVPLGIGAGVYLREVGTGTRLAQAIRFTANVLMGIPSIIAGLFIYTVVVLSMGRFSGIAGALSLAVIMLPVIARTTEDMLNLVPSALRESALALGAPRWRVTFGVVFRAARTGMLTGVLLAVARVSGETAPLLFTALNSTYWPTGLDEPTSNLTVTIFNYAMSPYSDWQQAAWGASLLIMGSVLAVTIVSRVLLREIKK
jgi:phosphate transport system permease protein